MRVKINYPLKKSRNPKEYKIRLENKIGKVIQVVGDGYCMIEFETIYRRKGPKTKWFQNKESFQWYVHELDFKEIKNKYDTNVDN